MKLTELRKLIVHNNIKIHSSLRKPQIIQELINHKVLPEDYVDKQPQIKKVVDEKFERLKYIRNNPRRVEVVNNRTGEVMEYPSMYAAGKAIGRAPRVIELFDGRVWDNKYKIKILV